MAAEGDGGALANKLPVAVVLVLEVMSGETEDLWARGNMFSRETVLCTRISRVWWRGSRLLGLVLPWAEDGTFY